VRNSIAAGRRLAARIVLVQAGISLLLAVVFLAQGWQSATSAFAGGALITLGNAMLAARMFAGENLSGGLALMRFFTGTALKWLIVLGGMAGLLFLWQIPPVPLFTGFSTVLLINLWALRFKDQAEFK
jgi:ATP synthase protein I